MTEDQRNPREFEDGLSSESEAEAYGGTQPPGSKTLRELLKKAPADRPEYAQDLLGLHSLIEHGGPDNCASSMWFRFLKDEYPAEYEALKAEHLGEGKGLQKGLPHTRRFAREELEHLDVNEDLIFCVDQQGDEEYGFFMHEADVLLWALGDNLTLDQIREYWQPYRPLWPTLYETSLQEWKEHWWPSLGGDFDTPVTTAFFMREVRNADISDAGYLGGYSMSTGEIFEVCGADALAAVRQALKGSYRIVLEDDLSNYTSVNPQKAMRLFEQTLMSEG